MTPHEEYLEGCKVYEEKMGELIEKKKLLRQRELTRISNLKKNEVTLVEYEWWQDMRREGSVSTRMY
jgi:hypothetical protein